MVHLDGESLTIQEVKRVARDLEKVEISPSALEKIRNANCFINDVLDRDQKIYGINTGFGKLANVSVKKEELNTLQRNLILSHACGVGELLPWEDVRAMMLIRANTLAKGYSGVRLEIIQTLVDMLNHGVTPLVPSQGSVGASGDLVPLAHLSLALLGEGEVFWKGRVLPSGEVLRQIGLTPLTLEAKEGLALINGTQFMAGIGSLCVYDIERLALLFDIASAVSFEVLRGCRKAFDDKVHRVRPHFGQIATAYNLRLLTKNSCLVDSDTNKVQDPYSLRCIPQIHGPLKDALAYTRKVLEVEINSANDNPLIFTEEEEVISGGNFHGQPLSVALDFLGLALCPVGNVSDRRIYLLLSIGEDGLPLFLTEDGGLNSGLMIPQYVTASLVSENKIYASPACVDSIPTSAGQEDHVSMGSVAARKLWRITANSEKIAAIELLCASQGLDFRDRQCLGLGTKKTYELVREKITPLHEDRILHSDINKIVKLVKSDFIEEVEKITGKLTLYADSYAGLVQC